MQVERNAENEKRHGMSNCNISLNLHHLTCETVSELTDRFIT